MNRLFDVFQTGFMVGHSTETALIRVPDDVLFAADNGQKLLLLLLDLVANRVILSECPLRPSRGKSFSSKHIIHVGT